MINIKHIIVHSFCLLGAAAVSYAADPWIAVKVTGNPDTNLVERVAKWIEMNMLPVRMVTNDAVTATGDNPGLAATLELSMRPSTNVYPDVARITGRTAYIDTQALRDPVIAEEQYIRRVERISMRSLAAIFGMQECPFPRCVMCTAGIREELDYRGRNFCPPCWKKWDDVLISVKGADLPPERPKDAK